jgi:hypothetical protein
MIVYERRACAILHNILRMRADARPFLIPANVCPIVPITFLEARQPFELVDVEEPSLEMDVNACLRKLHQSRYAGVLFVRPYGSERDPTASFNALRSAQPDLLIVDDKCLCRPDPDGERISPAADVTLFSTGYAKHTDLGSGGFAHVRETIGYRRFEAPFSDDALAEVTERYRRAIAAHTPFPGNVPGWLDLREPQERWEEYRERVVDEMRSADAHKRALNAIYARELPQEIQLPSELQNWRFNIRVPRPGELVDALFAAGLFASRHYASLGGVFASGRFTAAERIYSQVVNLFNDRYFDESRATKAAVVVRGHLSAE